MSIGCVGEGLKGMGCGRAGECRGLCRTCYSRAYLRVKAGDTTWEELERQGRALPAMTVEERRRRRSAFMGMGR